MKDRSAESSARLTPFGAGFGFATTPTASVPDRQERVAIAPATA